MTAEKAVSVAIVTSGIFTKEAEKFASGKPIDLIDGPQLVSLIRDVQTSGNIALKTDPNPVQKCPQCGAKLIKRTAKKGKNEGSQFWGCRNFPKCRYTESISMH